MVKKSFFCTLALFLQGVVGERSLYLEKGGVKDLVECPGSMADEVVGIPERIKQDCGAKL